ncbi:MAG: secretin and TonB N-terminal domain-containing protein [Planctomycetaceae bacterium]|nr:secretin and TonB N-terminal domain-containing protein [Planctomycetales bacterium]MCB9924004.1 secretin and TonB N-terminal domain-containing protein [Planctomycetaceae bacterium]
MQFILRLTVLGVFAAAGVALAISVAEHSSVPVQVVAVSEDGPGAEEAEETAADVNESLPFPVPTPVSNATPLPDPAVPSVSPEVPVVMYPVSAPLITQLPTAAPPLVAEYEPRIANQLDTLLETIERYQAKQNETADAVSRLREQMPPDNVAAPPPALPTPEEDLPEATLKQNGQVLISPDSDLVDIDAQDSDIRYVLKLLSKAGGLNILASPSVRGNVSASLQNVPIETALTALLKSTGFVYVREADIIYVGTPEDLRGMAHVAETVGSRIYRPDYVSATELQKLITPLLSTDVGQVTVSSPPEVGIASNATQAGGDTFAGGDVVMVRDYVTVLAEVDQVVAEVDRMPMQVAIEATILSVKLDDKDVLGVDFELLRNEETIRITSGTPLTSLATANFKDGLKVGFLDTSLFAFIEALETIGDTTVVASPRVMCLNKQRAEILIGSELGYVSTTVTETAATQAVEFLEVGTHLRIRPFVSTDGMVRMEVHPELSTGSVRVQEGFTLPDKDVTQVTTNIMCRSGATMVIGGLIREDLSASSTQIPVLGNLPYVGAAFRQRTETIVRREIIVLLTPRVVDEIHTWNEGDDYAKQFDDRLQTFRDKMTPIGKRQFGERYTRLANAAYAAGDLDTSLRYANLAIHFDPLNQAAINLREEIIEIAPDLEVGVHANLHRGLPLTQHPHRDYSRQGYPWRPIVETEVGTPTLHSSYDDGLPEVIRVEPARTDP